MIDNFIDMIAGSLNLREPRKARGFNTYEGFAAMIYLIAGKFKLAVPCPF